MKICPNAVSVIYLNIVIYISTIVGCPFGWRPVVSKGAMISCTSVTAICKSLNAAYECKQARWAVSESMFCCIKKDVIDDDDIRTTMTMTTTLKPAISMTPESFRGSTIINSNLSEQQSTRSTESIIDIRPSTTTAIIDTNSRPPTTSATTDNSVIPDVVKTRLVDELTNQKSTNNHNMFNVGTELLHVGSELLHIGGELLHMGKETNVNINTINELINKMNTNISTANGTTTTTVTATTEEPVVTFLFTLIPRKITTTSTPTSIDKETDNVNNTDNGDDNVIKNIVLPSKVVPSLASSSEELNFNNTVTLIPRKIITTTPNGLEKSIVDNVKNILLPLKVVPILESPELEPTHSRDIDQATSALPNQNSLVHGIVIEENGADIWNSSAIFTTISTANIAKPKEIDFGHTSPPTYVNVTQLYVLPDGVTQVVQLIEGKQPLPAEGTRMIHYAARASVTLLRTPNKNIIVDAGWPIDKYLLIDALRNQLHIKPAIDVDHVVITQERINTMGAVNIFRAADIITPHVYMKGTHAFKHPAMAGRSWYLDDGILITPTAGIFGREISVLVKNAVHFGRVAIVGHLFSGGLSSAALVNIPEASYKRRQRSRRKIICNVDWVVPIYDKMFRVTKAMQKRHNCPTVERRN